MNFELIPNSNPQSKGVSEEIFADDGSGSTDDKEERKKELELAISGFTFTKSEDAERAVSEYLDLTVPITYRVKFSFNPEK